ncbi:class I SAM-dependent methyltransferase [Roseibaca sp. Y0-43]|uniref:class I SAM-dependent methyltransferase n=1 Tax=Roseibaca sp. Y0-43 TaxID=2816854 RepID=UPI001D0C4154|nr:class I SAM-dependent methyltransferase [Roseibaca sp. Y0-43]MCC1480582.1 class I SAM-dependent methyltransferase [Roseibaca sp. Y0-43]
MPHAKTTPFAMPLPEALAHVDRVFGIDAILADEGTDILKPYYVQSEPGYKRVHSEKGCMHMALNPDGVYTADGYFAQIRDVAYQIRQVQGTSVLELGSGMGFNTIALAPDHPDVQFTGLDLMEHHVKTANKDAGHLPNATFRQGSYTDIPADLHGADVVFGLETLCYAEDLDAVAAQIAGAMAPGGRFVMYDGFRRADFDAAPEDVRTAARLFEVTTAVTGGFHMIEAWEAALTRAGLVVLRSEDLTDQSIAGMRYLHNRAAKFFRSWKYRVLKHVMPKYLIRNAVAGLVGPYMIEGAGPNSGDTMGAITYSVLMAEKPR